MYKDFKRWWNRIWSKDPHLTDKVIEEYPTKCFHSELWIVLREGCRYVRNNPCMPTRWRVCTYSSYDGDGFGNNVYTLNLITSDGKVRTTIKTGRKIFLEDESHWVPFKDLLLDLPDPI